MRRKLLSIVLTVFLLMLPVTAFAESVDLTRRGSVSVTLLDQDGQLPISRAELSLYYVAAAERTDNNSVGYTFTAEFENCGCALYDPALSARLDTFVQGGPAPVQKLLTDGSGAVTFADLPLGLYFVKQTNAVVGYAPCTSFLVTVPNETGDSYVYDVNASPKTEVARVTDITIRKVWNTDASAEAADSVTVQLLRDGVMVESATLSAENDWRVTYRNMPVSDGYSVVEVDVPDGFTATYAKQGNFFTVTNTASLIQTGQLVWPIPVLAIAGLFLLALGAIVLRRSRREDA